MHLFFFFFHFHICSFSFSRTLFLLSCITQIYYYDTRTYRTNIERRAKLKLRLFSSRSWSLRSTMSACSPRLLFTFSQHNIHIHLLRSSRARWIGNGKKIYNLLLINFEWRATFRRRSSARSSNFFEAEVPSIQENLGSFFFFLWINNILLTMDILHNCTIAPTHHCTWHGSVATDSLSLTTLYIPRSLFNINTVNKII